MYSRLSLVNTRGNARLRGGVFVRLAEETARFRAVQAGRYGAPALLDKF